MGRILEGGGGRAARHRLALAATLLVVGSFAACDWFLTTEPDAPDVAPPLPPLVSLETDLSFFQGREPVPDGSTANWDAAVAKIPFVEEAVGILVAPLEILRLASARTPERESELRWHWSIDFEHAAEQYTGYLAGIWGPVETEWGMIVSSPESDPPLSDYVWVVGAMAPSEDIGGWAIQGPASTTTAILRWALPPGTSDHTELRLEPTQDTHFDIQRNGAVWSISYFAADSADRFAISWNADNGKGLVSIADGEDMCWDEQLHDSDCIGLN